MIRKERIGFHCWYCDANLIEKGSEHVFVGINPGGDRKDDDLDLKEGNLEKPYKIPGWNVWFDGEQHNYQQAVFQVFEAVHGSGLPRHVKLKGLEIKHGPLDGTRVLGVPHLSRFGKESLYEKVRGVKLFTDRTDHMAKKPDNLTC